MLMIPKYLYFKTCVVIKNNNLTHDLSFYETHFLVKIIFLSTKFLLRKKYLSTRKFNLALKRLGVQCLRHLYIYFYVQKHLGIVLFTLQQTSLNFSDLKSGW